MSILAGRRGKGREGQAWSWQTLSSKSSPCICCSRRTLRGWMYIHTVPNKDTTWIQDNASMGYPTWREVLSLLVAVRVWRASCPYAGPDHSQLLLQSWHRRWRLPISVMRRDGSYFQFIDKNPLKITQSQFNNWICLITDLFSVQGFAAAVAAAERRTEHRPDRPTSSPGHSYHIGRCPHVWLYWVACRRCFSYVLMSKMFCPVSRQTCRSRARSTYGSCSTS